MVRWLWGHTKVLDLNSHALVQAHVIKRHVCLVWNELAIALPGNA